jgi:hypothetical protein
MAVHGNRLAGVTSDGGFVVWELPETITDDVPYVPSVYLEQEPFIDFPMSLAAKFCFASYLL